MSVADLEATTRSLGFLDSLHQDGTIVIGIVYLTGNAENKYAAERTAAALAKMSGPKSATIKTEIIGASELAQFSGQLDSVFLLPGVSAGADGLGDIVRRLHIVSISNDPACVDSKCCVLMIRTGGRVEIILDTTLADAVGAHFSSVFAMMVKRK